MMRALALLLFVIAAPAGAHETSREFLRTVIIAARGEETILWVRLPAPLLFADVARGAAPPAILTGEGRRLDRAAGAADMETFAYRLATAFGVQIDGAAVRPTVDAVVVRHAARLPVLTTPASADAAMAVLPTAPNPHVADSYVDAKLILPATGDLTLTAPADRIVLTGHVHLITTVIDARAEPPIRRTLTGAIGTPIALPGSAS